MWKNEKWQDGSGVSFYWNGFSHGSWKRWEKMKMSQVWVLLEWFSLTAQVWGLMKVELWGIAYCQSGAFGNTSLRGPSNYMCKTVHMMCWRASVVTLRWNWAWAWVIVTESKHDYSDIVETEARLVHFYNFRTTYCYHGLKAVFFTITFAVFIRPNKNTR